MPSVLKVNEIQNTGGDSALTIDDDGVVTLPQVPAFQVCLNSGWTAHANGAQLQFSLDSVGNATFDQGGNFDTTNYHFTAPVDGVYSFTLTVYTHNSDAVGSFNLTKNQASSAAASAFRGGTGTFHLQVGEDAAQDCTYSQTWLIKLEAGDIIRAYCISAADTYGHHTYWNGYLIG